jgi:RNA polymerase sigma-70 factor (ECF subfamily)
MMDAEETTEMRLIRCWRSGDRHSGDRLLRRYVPVLHNYFARRVSGNVDELVQRTLYACVEAVTRYEGRSSFKTYLLGIAHHQFLISLRSEAVLAHDGRPRATQPDESPSQLVAFREEQYILVSALIKIDPEFLAVLKLFYWGQLSVEEIAEQLDIPAGTVKSRLARGRAALKANLESMKLRPALREDALRELASFFASRNEGA